MPAIPTYGGSKPPVRPRGAGPLQAISMARGAPPRQSGLLRPCGSGRLSRSRAPPSLLELVGEVEVGLPPALTGAHLGRRAAEAFPEIVLLGGALGGAHGPRAPHARHHEHDLVAAEADHRLTRPDALCERRADRLDQGVATV